MPKDLNEPELVAGARWRLDRCERALGALRDLLGELTRNTPAYAAALTWTEEVERSCFCRRLELEELLRERRTAQIIPLRRPIGLP